jgi:hypothetical protein
VALLPSQCGPHSSFRNMKQKFTQFDIIIVCGLITLVCDRLISVLMLLGMCMYIVKCACKLQNVPVSLTVSGRPSVCMYQLRSHRMDCL